jgi:hypothetical protein
MQMGPPMQKQLAEHLKPTRDLTNIFDFGTGCQIRSDAKGEMAPGFGTFNAGNVGAAAATEQRYRELRAKQHTSPWRIHQSCALERKGRCHWPDGQV